MFKVNTKKNVVHVSVLFALFLCFELLMGCAGTNAKKDPVPVAPKWVHTPSPSPSGGVGGNAAPTNAPVDYAKLEDADAVVVLYQGNKIYDMLPLEDRVYTIDQGNGMVNVITIDSQGVHMSHSTCDNQDCVQQGEITLSNYETRVLMSWVICLPNQVSIELVVREDQS